VGALRRGQCSPALAGATEAHHARPSGVQWTLRGLPHTQTTSVRCTGNVPADCGSRQLLLCSIPNSDFLTNLQDAMPYAGHAKKGMRQCRRNMNAAVLAHTGMVRVLAQVSLTQALVQGYSQPCPLRMVKERRHVSHCRTAWRKQCHWRPPSETIKYAMQCSPAAVALPYYRSTVCSGTAWHICVPCSKVLSSAGSWL
jgi:hypothetical protein